MLEEVPFNLHDIAQSVLEVIEKMAEERKIEITQDNIGVAHWNLIGSPVYVKRIMMNFISNAVKYNKEHGKIMLRCREISTEGDTAVFEFTCRDTGIGMSGNSRNIFLNRSRRRGSAVTANMAVRDLECRLRWRL